MKLSKFLLAAGLFVLPMLGLNLQAQQSTAVWNPAANPTQPSDGLWTTVDNWVNSTNGTINELPGPGVKAADNVTIPCVVNAAAGGGQVVFGDGADGSVLVVTNGGILECGDGTLGSLDAYGWTGIGYSHLSTMIIESGASVQFAYHVWLGLNPGGNGILIMNGGTATITNGNGAFGIGTSGGTGSVTLNGGSLNINNNIQLPTTATNQINLAGGSLILAGNATGTVSPLIATNKIVAYGGTGTVTVDTISDPGFTVLTGVPGVTPPRPMITQITVGSGDNVTIYYSSQANSTYHVEVTPSLSPESWSTILGSSTVATGSSTTFNYTDTSGTNQFYRVGSP